MSIKVMANVWELSKQKNSALLLMLALADHANDGGVCWPSITRLAAKIRRTERHTKRLLAKLEAAGEVFRLSGIGRGNMNRYLVTVGFTADELLATLVRRFELAPAAAQAVVDAIMTTRNGDADVTITEAEKVTFLTGNGDISGERVTFLTEKGDIAMSPEPSCNRHENHHENHHDGASAPPTPPPRPAETVKFDTPEARKLQARLRASQQAIDEKRTGPRRFGSLEQKRKFLKAVEVLGGAFDEKLQAAMEEGINSTARAVNFLAACARNKGNGRGKYAPHQRDSRIIPKPPAQAVDPAQVERDRAALREHRAARTAGSD